MSYYVVTGYVEAAYIGDSDTFGGITFDGATKRIILSTDTVSVDYIWSRWCDWHKQNPQYPLAMRYVGGDSISATKKLGVTFFILNNWRIRPMEADHTLRVDGNLYTDPAGFSPFVRTLGSFNVMVESSVSSLVDSTIQQLPEIEHMVYGDAVHIDTVLGTAGTVYPAAAPRYPVNTLADAKTVAAYRGFTNIHLAPGTLTIGATESLNGLTLMGSGIENSKVVLTAGCTTSKATFRDLTVSGTQAGETHYERCEILAMANVHCRFVECLLVGPMALLQGTYNDTTVLANCYTGYEPDNVFPALADEFVLDMANSSVNVIFAGLSGKMKVINLNRSTTPGTIEINMTAGKVTIDASCTTGVIKVRGSGELVNNATGTNVDADVILPTELAAPAIASAVWSALTRTLTSAGAGGATAAEIRTELSAELAQITKVSKIHGVGVPLVYSPTSRVAGDLVQTFTTVGDTTTVSAA